MNLLIQDKVLVQENKAKSQFVQKGFGEKKESKLVLDLLEAAYLVKKKKLKVHSRKGEELSEDELVKLGQKKNKKFYSVYLVFSDLRERGFVVKTGFKFGFDLRVYPRGKKPGQEHTKWVVNVSTQNEKTSMIGLSRMARLSGNIRATMLQAVVDSEDDINYYEIKRLTP